MTTENPDSELKKVAIAANGETWKFLQAPKLTSEERAAMLGAAYASLYVWDRIGTDLHRARGHWLVSRAATVAGAAELALTHAELCGRFTASAAEKKDFDEAYAVEAMARATAARGDLTAARRLRSEASRLGAALADEEDRSIFVGDLKSGPWFGLAAE